jgi:hypothetical protein
MFSLAMDCQENRGNAVDIPAGFDLASQRREVGLIIAVRLHPRVSSTDARTTRKIIEIVAACRMNAGPELSARIHGLAFRGNIRFNGDIIVCAFICSISCF